MINKLDRKKLEKLYKDALRKSKELSTSNDQSSYTFCRGYEHGIKDVLYLFGCEQEEFDAMFQEIMAENN